MQRYCYCYCYSATLLLLPTPTPTQHNTTQYITYLVNTYPANSTRRRNNVRASVSLSTSMPS
jgi:hypothetical protein